MTGIKGQDIVVLLKLISLDEQEKAIGSANFHQELPSESLYSVRNLQRITGISKTEINASIHRCLSIGLSLHDRTDGRIRVNRRNLLDFIVHGLKYTFPAKPGAMTRGIPTAFAAPMIRNVLISVGEYIYVWPYAEGRDIGQSIQPLFRTVPFAAQKDERLYEYLALVDSIRIGNQREASVAKDALSKKLYRQ